jgi:hypothetical protein
MSSLQALPDLAVAVIGLVQQASGSLVRAENAAGR